MSFPLFPHVEEFIYGIVACAVWNLRYASTCPEDCGRDHEFRGEVQGEYFRGIEEAGRPPINTKRRNN